ncbi:MAG: hypothetical protein R2804_05985 [Cyclobacteriaceae bacterium]
MKKIVFGWSFILLYGVALLRPIHPLVEYYANQDFFAKVLCINKDKPEMACNGKCILMQKLKRVAAAPVEQTSDTPPLQKINLTEYPIGFVQFTNHIQSRFGKNSIAHSEYILHWPDSPVIEIDHPPA